MATKEIERAIASIEEAVPRNLKQLRVERHLSQKALADRSKVDIRNISAIERGHRRHVSTKTLAKLAHGLECRATDLVRGPKEADDDQGIAPAIDECIKALKALKAKFGE